MTSFIEFKQFATIEAATLADLFRQAKTKGAHSLINMTVKARCDEVGKPTSTRIFTGTAIKSLSIKNKAYTFFLIDRHTNANR